MTNPDKSHSRTARADSYSRAAMLLHWLIAGALAFQIGMGWRIEKLSLGDKLFDLVQLHKSVGITIFLLSLLRLSVRFFKPPPPPISDDKWAHFLSKWTHIALYAFMIGAPLTGWLAVSSSKLNIDTMLFSTVYWPHIPGIAGLEAETKHLVHELSEEAHKIMTWIGISLFLLHVAGALRHQFMKSEPLLARMLAAPVAEKRVAGTAAIVCLAVLLGAVTISAKLLGNEANQSKAVEVPKPVVSNNEEPAEINPLATKDSESNTETIEVIPEEQTTTAAQIETQTTISSWTITQKNPIRFSVIWNGNAVQGSLSSWDADIKFSPDALDQSSIAVTVNVTSAKTDDATLVETVLGPDFFAVSSFPRAEFTSSRIRSVGGNSYEASGNLTLKNLSQPAKIVFTLDVEGSNASVNGTANISRSAHRIGVGDYEEIDDDVNVSFDFSAKQ